MKKAIITLGICGAAALTGCANDSASPGDRDGSTGIYQQSGNTLNVNDQRPDLYNEDGRKGFKDKSEDFGYVRHQRSGVMGAENNTNAYQALDRENIADMIGKFSTMVPNVDDVSTLVTDEEVLIVYQTDSGNRSETADQVKRMAMSVVPRWFHVYVSDDTSLRNDVENFATLDTDSRDVDELIDGVVKQMLKSPQGRDMSTGENANGEAKGELNEKMDKDDISNQMNNGK
ncbi:YhcN/YlaJ family sporulation lipoprotein [Mesobacillus subterraneus]|uniref:YhcN/YlaJ family sporulation lipoprotein n=1 Tax=Mesobacillus subterraneus TaxID=285983 RepID=UPI00203B68CA|nr:YhcN/YlaJ family sporulation lipoprotein [Mesobacillus subterraneus]MCM3663335.1 YhcN/YlaJ family sporulation lipoprotein [Mesobacillus subterraneus]MCM3683108.1 YhcN/YlaJ family sporulation lipoprotein [Mesobacillus subterraneus]